MFTGENMLRPSGSTILGCRELLMNDRSIQIHHSEYVMLTIDLRCCELLTCMIGLLKCCFLSVFRDQGCFSMVGFVYERPVDQNVTFRLR